MISAQGPERIEGAWWSEPGAHAADNRARDYFRVEDKSGLRFWLYRSGLYRDLVRGDLANAAPPSWFLHGTFA